MNQTLFMSEVNSTRLYDFAVRSLVRLNPLSDGLSVILFLMEDLCLQGYFKLAVNIFNQGLHRLSSPPTDPMTDKNKMPYSNKWKKHSVRNMTHLEEESYNQTRQNCILLQKYFLVARQILTTEHFPRRAYKVAAHVFKDSGMHDLIIDLYKYAIYDNAADKQFKNLVVYNLARSPDYWDAALDILNNLKEKPDLFMYTSGILACEKGKDWEQAIYLLDKLQLDGYNLSTVIVTSAISACASGGRATEALHLLDMMINKNITPNVWTYNSVLSACAKVGRWRDALVIFQMMRGETPQFLVPFEQKSFYVLNEEGKYIGDGDNTNEEDDEDDDMLDNSDESIGDDSVLNSTDDVEEDFFTPFEVSSNKFTYNTIIEVLGEGGQTHLIDEIYRNALSQGIFNPFHNIRMGNIDLHSHTSHMAEAALRYIFGQFQTLINGFDGDVTLKNDKIIEEIDENSKIYLKLVNESSVTVMNKSFYGDDNNSNNINNSSSNNNNNSNSNNNNSNSNNNNRNLSLELTIIIGKGSTLKNVVEKFLLKDLYPPLPYYIPKQNSGRIVIPRNLLLEWIKYQKNFI